MMRTVRAQPQMTDDQELQSLLKRRTRFARLVHVPTCASTQALAEADLRENPEGPIDAVFWADHQTDGRGRQERSWDDDAGRDLAVTMRVQVALSNPVALPAALPVAVLQACEPFAGAALRIKWPNDIYEGARKLSGVLVDHDSSRPGCYRIGVGINVNRRTFPSELAPHATSLRLLSGREHSRQEVLGALALRVDAAITAVTSGGDADAHEALFRERLGLLGREVEVHAGESMAGELTAIDFERLVIDGRREVPLAIVTRLQAREG